MALPFYNWSRTASSNATADSTVNWQEGQAPSTVNDSARAMMASTAAFRDDISCGIAAGGTNNAITVTSYQVFDTLAHAANQIIGFRATATNSGSCTINVDGLGAKALRLGSGVDCPAGTIISGSPYQCVYNVSDDVFYLIGIIGQPYSVPIGGLIDFAGTSAPNSSFVFPYGQAISRTTYSTLFGLTSTAYGTGDGSTTFNLPDLRGRIIAGKDDMGGSAASRLSSTSITTGGPTTLGGSGGADTKTILTANLPAYTPAGTISNGSISLTVSGNPAFGGTAQGGGGASGFTAAGTVGAISASQGSSTFTGTAQGGTSTAFSLAQPTLIMNKLIRII